MSEFIRPQVQVEEINETSARVSVEPLERGYGDTLGTPFVAFFCPSLEGAAVEAIRDRWRAARVRPSLTWSRMSPTSS